MGHGYKPGDDMHNSLCLAYLHRNFVLNVYHTYLSGLRIEYISLYLLIGQKSHKLMISNVTYTTNITLASGYIF